MNELLFYLNFYFQFQSIVILNNINIYLDF